MTTRDNQTIRIIYLYCITCLINQKTYIGQTIDPTSRWRGHRRDSADPKVPLQFAIKKYGAHNFEFKIIASCKGQDNANELETLLVAQYDSFITNNKGYNATHGGANSPKTDEWKQKLKDWHASLSEEEKLARNKKLSQSFTKYLQENEHPCQGQKRTPEQIENIRNGLLNREDYFTPELRQRMRESHLGQKHSVETVEKRKASLKVTNDAKIAQKLETGEFKCNAPDCERTGADEQYALYQNVRYCSKHASRLHRNGTLETKPVFRSIGQAPPNKIIFTQEQVTAILADTRSAAKIGKYFGVTEKVIVRVRRENKV